MVTWILKDFSIQGDLEITGNLRRCQTKLLFVMDSSKVFEVRYSWYWL